MNLYDYLFYRIADWYKKKKDSAAESTGMLLVSLIQFFTLFDMFVIFRWFWEFPLPQNINKYWALPILIIIPIVNWYRYVKPRMYREYRKKWRQEDINKRRKKGWLLVLYLITCMLIPIMTGFVKHNLGL
jgi:magnesium-transporting ATPase (P-type)